MANYQRYQVLTSAQQYLFSPACPVFVSKYQISGDMAALTPVLIDKQGACDPCQNDMCVGVCIDYDGKRVRQDLLLRIDNRRILI